MNLKKNIHLLLLLGILSVVCSCSIRKYIPAEERIYTGASVSLESDSTIANKAQLRNVLEGVLRPEPNTKFLGGYPGLFYYYKAHRENPGFINRWLYRQFGEEPVYQSDVEPYQVEELLLNRLANRGFFYSRAASKFYEEENFASVQYTVTVPEPYTMATYQLDSVPLPLYGAMAPIVANSKLEKGIRFDLSALKLERERIDNELKKKGYYNFNPGFLIFEADTNQYDRKKFDLFLRLKNDVPHEATIPYKIAQLNIHPNHDLRQDSLQTDTIRYEGKNYIQENEFFKPKYLDRYITLEEGERYDPIASKNT
ncbi:MAG: hypothetical protein CMC08_06240, partial [Flavobacteriaceae bacterium]|nr:hypothetical protein [Flavobacteriaceae bacterium]